MNERAWFERSLGKLEAARKAIQEQREAERRAETRRYVEERRRALREYRENPDILLEPDDYGYKGERR